VVLPSQALQSRGDHDGGDLEFRSTDDRKHALPDDHQQMFRRSLTDEQEVAYYVVHAPEHTSLEAMVLAAGKRWPVEECFESAKGEVGLGDYEVRTYTGWYRHMTLCLVAHSFLAAARVMAHKKEPPLSPKVLALPHCRNSMLRFRRRQGLASSASRSKRSDA